MEEEVMTIRNKVVTDRHPDGTPLGPPANPNAQCMSGPSGFGDCPRRATQQRAIGEDGPAMPFCEEHARELDESSDAMWERS
jgi:hypothetical protein